MKILLHLLAVLAVAAAIPDNLTLIDHVDSHFELPDPAATPVRYDGVALLSVVPRDREQLDTLTQLMMNMNTTMQGLISWYSEPTAPGVGVMSGVKTENLPFVQKYLDNLGFSAVVTIPDIQNAIDDEASDHQIQNLAGFLYFDQYNTFVDIQGEINRIAAAHVHLSTISVGKSYEGRDMFGVKVSTGTGRPAIWLDCGMHAREWVSVSVCMHVINRLATTYGKDAATTAIVDKYDWYILPVANPDGYAYTWTSDRMWRKNRQQNAGSSCRGVDLNRNFDSHFGEAGTSRDPCSDIYRGPFTFPFSAPESKAISKYLPNIPDLKAFVSIHSYSQLWMSPYGYTTARPKDYSEHMQVMEASVDALRAVEGTRFKYGPINEVIYPASGSSVDWAYEKKNIKYSFALELRDTGRYGFMLPKRLIKPTCEETWAGLVAMAKAIGPEFGVDI